MIALLCFVAGALVVMLTFAVFFTFAANRELKRLKDKLALVSTPKVYFYPGPPPGTIDKFVVKQVDNGGLLP